MIGNIVIYVGDGVTTLPQLAYHAEANETLHFKRGYFHWIILSGIIIIVERGSLAIQ